MGRGVAEAWKGGAIDRSFLVRFVLFVALLVGPLVVALFVDRLVVLLVGLLLVADLVDLDLLRFVDLDGLFVGLLGDHLVDPFVGRFVDLSVGLSVVDRSSC